jgi:hypothetical protein
MSQALIERSSGVFQSIDSTSNPTIFLDPFNQQDLSDHYLKTNIQCFYSCRHPAHDEIITLQLPFVPSQEGLTPGDGTSGKDHIMWRGLTATLRLWSQEACVREATFRCLETENVLAVKVKQISSGEWKWDNKIGCDKKTPIVPSPFGENMNIDTSAVGRELLISPKEILMTLNNKTICNQDILPILEKEKNIYPSMKSFRENRPLKNIPFDTPTVIKKSEYKTGTNDKDIAGEKCQNKVTINLCFGDCIDLEQKNAPETLMTPNPTINEELIVCLDEWKSSITAQNLSPDILQWSCESNVWRQLKDRNILGLSCAAARIIVKCPAF